MNLLNVILSVIISVVVSYFSIKNISKEKFDLKSFIIYLMILIPLLIISCLYFNGITKLILNIIFTITTLYLSIYKKDWC